MAFNLAIVILAGLLAHYLFTRLRMPGLVGMLLAGLLCGPHGFNLLDKSLLELSYDLRLVAFLVLLLKAGLTLRRDLMNEVGKSVVPLGIIPALFEFSTITFFAQDFLDFSFIEAALLGAVLSAVSPAVVIPMMVHYQEHHQVTNKKLPTLIIAASSIDNVLVLTVFSTCMGFFVGEDLNITYRILSLPLSILLGAVAGAGVALILVKWFHHHAVRATKKTLVVLSLAIVLSHVERYLSGTVPFSSILAVLTMGFILLERAEEAAHGISRKLSKLWILAEIILFILVGASVDLTVVGEAGGAGLLILAIGLAARSFGVWLATLNAGLSSREVLFCIFSYLPKATIQALVGAIPLSYGVAGGEIILAISVLSIVITAPLGAILTDQLGKKVLLGDSRSAASQI